MKEKSIKEVMVALSDYATVSEDAPLETAIRELKKARSDSRYIHKHRAVLAFDHSGRISGKVSFRCIVKALEPKYGEVLNPDGTGLSRFGFSPDFLASLIDDLNLWDDTFEALVKKGVKRKVKEIMHTPSNSEYVNVNASMAEALHHFILGCHQSLLVTQDGVVVGVLRLSDMFNLVCDTIE